MGAAAARPIEVPPAPKVKDLAKIYAPVPTPWSAIPDSVLFYAMKNGSLKGAVVIAIARATFAAPSGEGEGGRNQRRPVWSKGSIGWLAGEVNSTVPGVEKILAELRWDEERNPSGLIEIVRGRPDSCYRLRVENFPEAECRKPRKPAASEGAAKSKPTQQGGSQKQEPVQLELIPRAEAQSLSLEMPCSLVKFRVDDAPALSLTTIMESGILSVHISRSSFATNKGDSQSRTTVQGGLRVDSAFSDRVRVALNRLLESSLGAMEDSTCDQIASKLQTSGVAIDELCRRVHERHTMFTGAKGTWGGVITLLDGMITAKQKARRAEEKQKQIALPADLSPEDIAWLKKHGGSSV